MSNAVKIVAYQAAWIEEFIRERDGLLTACGTKLTAIEHIGSTSVPGLAAKPIIDILAGVSEPELLSVTGESTTHSAKITPAGNAAHVALVESVCRLGYVYRGEYGIPRRLFFGKPATPPRLVHIHLVLKDSAFWRNHLKFREYLRAHPDAAERYGALKRRLAEEYGSDRDGYTNAKSAFITQCLHAAHELDG